MPVGLIPVDAAPAELRVDLHIDRSARGTTVQDSSRFDALKDEGEVFPVYAKTVVKSREGLGPFIKVERQALVHIDGAEWP